MAVGLRGLLAPPEPGSGEIWPMPLGPRRMPAGEGKRASLCAMGGAARGPKQSGECAYKRRSLSNRTQPSHGRDVRMTGRRC